MRIRLILTLMLAPILVAMPASAKAMAGESLIVAVAANFHRPMREIAEAFEQQTGNSVRVVSGSTGKLYAQIIQGAPFHLFFAADARRPALLESEGLIKTNSRFNYVTGSLVLWTPDETLDLEGGLATALNKRVERIAVANPKTAPYGVAAMQALDAAGLTEQVQSKLIFGESVAQAVMFAHSGNAQLAILPASSIVGAGGKSMPLTSGYQPIIQQAVVLKGAPKSAEQFAAFLSSPAARTVLNRYSYGIPQ
ncbi:MAG: molybdate ABC transporter substrate-binding protein [Mariprofundaceae bacterium]